MGNTIVFVAQTFVFVVFNNFLVYNRFKEFVNGIYGADGAYFHGNEGPNALYTEHIASPRLQSCWTRFLKIPTGILS